MIHTLTLIAIALLAVGFVVLRVRAYRRRAERMARLHAQLEALSAIYTADNELLADLEWVEAPEGLAYERLNLRPGAVNYLREDD